jgi:N-formylglutamate amidohydrolase
MLWKPAGGGVSALVTVICLDLDRDKAQVHVARVSTGLCAAHWVDMAALSEAPKEAKPCACASKPGEDDHAA